jgi:hypothetical protein
MFGNIFMLFILNGTNQPFPIDICKKFYRFFYLFFGTVTSYGTNHILAQNFHKAIDELKQTSIFLTFPFLNAKKDRNEPQRTAGLRCQRRILSSNCRHVSTTILKIAEYARYHANCPNIPPFDALQTIAQLTIILAKPIFRLLDQERTAAQRAAAEGASPKNSQAKGLIREFDMRQLLHDVSN